MSTPMTQGGTLNGILNAASGLTSNIGQTSLQNQGTGLLGAAPGSVNANTVNGAGMNTSLANGVTNMTPAGPLAGANTGIQNMANTGANLANQSLIGGGQLPQVNQAGQLATNTAAGQVGTLQAGQQNASALMNAGTAQINNPLIGQADAAASSNIKQAGTDFNSVYNTQLSSLMKQLQMPQQLQMNANNQGQFSRGQMGTTGGALQTQAMATGFGQADLAASQQAYNQAMQTQAAATSAAGVLGTLGSNQQLTGANMTGTGTNALTGLGAGAVNAGTTGLNSALTNAEAPATVAGAYNQGAVNPAVANANAINQQGINTAQLGVNTGTAMSNSDINAGYGLDTAAQSSTSPSNLSNVLGAIGGIQGITGAATGAYNALTGTYNALTGVTGAQNAVNSGVNADLSSMTDANLSTSMGLDSSLTSGSAGIDTSWLNSIQNP